ncbi:MAG: GLPGLI family protein [Microscillaceae bacterium]|nr:GLPGLI family protein [Microscillaceae bacterium]
MIRLTLFMPFIIFLSNNLFSQEIKGCAIYYEIINFRGDSFLKGDSSVLFFNSDTSLYIKNPQFNIIRENVDTISIPDINLKLEVKRRYVSEPIYKYKNQSLTYSLFQNGDSSEIYYVLDSLPKFNWKITSIKKNILGLDCFKAISNEFRGRVYEVWFTYEIPISSGPWKLGGLPGLILEANDVEEQIFFRIMKAEYPTSYHCDFKLNPLIQHKSIDYHINNIKEVIKKFRESIAIIGEVKNNKLDAMERFPELLEIE